MNCRHCNSLLGHCCLDLGAAPPSNAYLSAEQLNAPEVYFPLKLYVCTTCWLVQTEDYAHAEHLFVPDYAYFSSTSSTWVEHVQRYVDQIVSKLGLDGDSFVIEVASNDGCLLQNFVAKKIPCLGIEPTDSTASAAERIGVPVLRRFFGEGLGRELAGQGRQADLITGNNVFAHVPDINDFTRGLQAALKTGGTITLEFPHVLCLLQHIQFDTVYHEHYSYLSLYTACRILTESGLRVFDVEKLPTHGGSLRVYVCHREDHREDTGAVEAILAEEEQFGLRALDLYQGFQTRVNEVKDGLVEFLIAEKRSGRKVAGYGAAAKGNTLLNYAGVRPDLIPFVCDAAPSKQCKFLPGSRIPILPPAALRERRPDTILILPWNIAPEVREQLAYVRDWGGRFVVAIPRIELLP